MTGSSTFPRLFGLAATAVFAVALLASCGGGGTSSGGGGLDKSSTVVLHVNSVSGGTAFRAPVGSERGVQLFAALLSDWIVGTAWAGTAGVTVLMDGAAVGTTDANGDIMFAATPGFHTITLVSGTAQASFDINIPADTIVTISDITVSGQQITYDPPDYADGTDSVAQKTTVCHKDKETISVGDPSVAAHLAHGDYIGACAVAAGDPAAVTNGGKNNANGGKKNS